MLNWDYDFKLESMRADQRHGGRQREQHLRADILIHSRSQRMAREFSPLSTIKFHICIHQSVP